VVGDVDSNNRLDWGGGHIWLAGPERRQGSATMKSQILTLTELARYLRCHETTIYRMMRGHQLPAFKIGGVWRFKLDEIEKWQKEGGSRK
jgi:excisionase family DNA binding protein